MKARKAVEQDIEHWLRMRNCLWPESLLTNRKAIEQYFLAQSEHICNCILIEISHVPVGFIELNIRNYAEGSKNEQVPFVEGWYVDKEFRDQGLGTRLMKQAEVWAREIGYTEIASDTNIENTISISAHKKLGFKETDRIVCFLKQLS